jgi:parallel beta-helix repeat protein
MRQALREAAPDHDMLVVRGGSITLPEMVNRIKDPAVLQQVGDAVLFRVPLLIDEGATLVIRERRVLLSAPDRAVIVNGGRLFVVDSNISSWDPALQTLTTLVDDEQFRPFLLGGGGSETYIAGSHLRALGFAAEKAYGLTVSSGPARAVHPPRLWLIDSTLTDLFYGVYTFEAADIVIAGNRFLDNIVYGIDPHDASERMLIIGNVVERTRRRHGIVLSKKVRDSWIIGNLVRNSAGSGIVLDNRVEGVVIEGNMALDNAGDGIALLESRNVQIRNNRLLGNGRDGIRVRNSTRVTASDNLISGSGSDGMELYAEATSAAASETEPAAQAVVCRNATSGVRDALLELSGVAQLEWLLPDPLPSGAGALLKLPDENGVVASALSRPATGALRVTSGQQRSDLEWLDPGGLERKCAQVRTGPALP